MRIALFDGLLETHVASSLERSLLRRGHDVLNTGKIGHGFLFETDPQRLESLRLHVQNVLDFAPDVILVFRPASLPPALLKLIKSSGAHLAVWLSDDPVLWDLSYRPIINEYDTIWHCGSERVLRHYDEEFGRAVGVNVPFWTDEVAFPYVYGSNSPESDLMFLGNVHDEVRRRRYFDMAGMRSSIRIHGNVGLDFRNLGAGYLDSDAEVVDAASRARLALNVPQYFKDHKGLPTWFDGLDELGTFQYPSRVIQYAAMGLPILSVTPDSDDYRTFPEITCVPEFSAVDDAAARLLVEQDLEALSRATHERFYRHYSADSRALALESIVTDDSWRALSARERSEWFTRFVPEPVPVTHDADTVSPSITLRSQGTESQAETESPEPQRVVIAGVGWTRPASAASVAARALRRLGHDVHTVTPFTHPEAYLKDPSKEHHSFIRPEVLFESLGDFSALILVGTTYGVSASGRHHLSEHGTALIHHAVVQSANHPVTDKVLQRADAVSFTTRSTATTARSLGFGTVRHLPPLVDRDFVDLCEGESLRPVIRTVGTQRKGLSSYPDLIADLSDIGAETSFDDELSTDVRTLDDLRDLLANAVTVLSHDVSLPGTQADERFPFALATGSIVITPRIIGDASVGEPGVDHLCSRDRYELARKLIRLRDDRHRFDALREAARSAISTKHSAERQLQSLLDAGISHVRAACGNIAPSLVCSATLPKSGVLASQRFSTRRLKAHGRAIRLDVRRTTGEPTRSDAFVLEVALGTTAVLRAKLCRLPESSWITLMPDRARPWPDSIEVRLRLTSPVERRNWAHETGLRVEFSETPAAADRTDGRIMTSAPCYMLVDGDLIHGIE